MMDLSKCTVLVVDDTALNIDLLLECLGEEYDVAVAMDGASALEAASEDPPDLILLDIMMPEMDGYEVCQRLKANPATADIPVIFVTAMGETEDETRGLELGAVDYITKPISPPIVRARVRNHLALKMARQDLETRNQELQQSYQDLRELEQLRDSLTHMIVHDMRSPLLGILGGIKMALMDGRDKLDAESVKDLEMAMDTNQRLIEMIGSLLDVSRLEAGEMQLSTSTVDLAEVVQEALSSLGALAKKCRVVSDPECGHLSAHCDPDVIRRVVVNLVGNGIKFTPANGEVRVRWRPETDGVRLEVIDTGPGIPPESQQRIFEKFGQVKDRAEGRKLSTGLGLTFCKLAVEAHGGHIGVDSQPDEGSTFWFTLPG